MSEIVLLGAQKTFILWAGKLYNLRTAVTLISLVSLVHSVTRARLLMASSTNVRLEISRDPERGDYLPGLSLAGGGQVKVDTFFSHPRG